MLNYNKIMELGSEMINLCEQYNLSDTEFCIKIPKNILQKIDEDIYFRWGKNEQTNDNYKSKVDRIQINFDKCKIILLDEEKTEKN